MALKTPELQPQNPMNPALSGMNLWLVGLIIILGAIILVEGGIIISLKRSASSVPPSPDRLAPAGRPSLWEKILPGRWMPSAGPRKRQVSQDDRIVLWESAQDIETIHDQINRLFSALTTPHAPLHPIFSNLAPIRATAGPATDPMLQVQREINLIFESAFNDMDIFSLPGRLEKSWNMCAVSSSMQVEDQGSNIVVQMALPGLDASAMAISLQGQLLTITVNPSDDEQNHPAGHGRPDAYAPRERMETKIMLPGPVDASAAQATYGEDILRIEIPKSAEKEPLARTIKVI
ncbi:MAG: Hsp20 family protein [Verrucomicrobia bacterium]|nr:Hsp20 family protein [Verrucomicrobiota bacterium]MBU4247407.1 Hsp20 family protein [Verrucomicrobiota bacterium]MBU4290945.1 Hsp20 family protein [Verrucomicrobiota bacterium]MBU4497790.1 Hsp20 family protein [Verrucomicrobiota bacterium]MCG2681667.1 Hsp20 family protein [Kiritimatiellia bacterium]